MGEKTQMKIVAAARLQIGLPCRMRRVSPSSLMGCEGIVLRVARDLGMDCPDSGGFSAVDHRYPTPILLRHFDPKSTADMKPGDLLVFRIGRAEHHFGIATEVFGQPAFVHAYDKTRRVVEVGLDRAWRRRLCGCYSFRRAV